MDYTSDPLSNQHPNARDYEELVSIYSHLDSSSDGGGSGGGGCFPPNSKRCRGAMPVADILAEIEMNEPASPMGSPGISSRTDGSV